MATKMTTKNGAKKSAAKKNVKTPAAKKSSRAKKRRKSATNDALDVARIEQPRFEGDKDEYNRILSSLQLKLLQLQRTYFRLNKRAVVVFEGSDAAGKGGVIRRLTEKLDPRGVRVHAVSAPTVDEKRQHYLERFFARLPPRGSFAIFDRSWYGRVLVERVEGFAETEEWRRAYREIREFEQWLAADDIRVIKVFLHITPDEQMKRFRQRLLNPYKRWKLTMEDLRNRDKTPAYVDAVNDMLHETGQKTLPWVVVGGDHKWNARLQSLAHIVTELSRDVDVRVPGVTADVRKLAEALGVDIDDVTAAHADEAS